MPLLDGGATHFLPSNLTTPEINHEETKNTKKEQFEPISKSLIRGGTVFR